MKGGWCRNLVAFISLYSSQSGKKNLSETHQRPQNEAPYQTVACLRRLANSGPYTPPEWELGGRQKIKKIK